MFTQNFNSWQELILSPLKEKKQYKVKIYKMEICCVKNQNIMK